MSDHLPECIYFGRAENNGPSETCTFCSMLRACEQRVSKEALQDAKARESNGITWAQAYSAALNAAREAVANIEEEYVGDEYEQGRMALRVARTLIETLREGKT